MPSSGVQTCALDRKSTRLNSSHTIISYAVFCLKKKRVGSEEHTSELQSHDNLVCRPLLEKKAPTGAFNAPASPAGAPPPCVPPAPPRPAGPPAARRALGTSPRGRPRCDYFSFFFNHRAPPELYPLSLPGALPI